MKSLHDWPRVKVVLEGALACGDADREAYLVEACGTDASLRAQVERLLAVRNDAGTFLETPAAQLLNEPRGREDLTGRAASSYRLLSRLGGGGMGDVYLAHDDKLDRRVALKVLSPELAADHDRLRRFHQEARAASSLNHPHIVVVHDFGDLDGRPYMVTEFIEGETLGQRLRHGPLPAREAVDFGIQIAVALAAAHARGLVHRDIKPDNIMVRPDGYVKVLDFGLAKLTTLTQSSDPGMTSRTQAGMVMGTPRYMSPEQARGLDLDARSDVWSLGVVLYEMMSGRPPFDGATPADIIAAILGTDPEPADRLNPDVPSELGRIITKTLQKDRLVRYQTAADLRADMLRLQRAPDSIRVAAPAERPLASVAVLPFRDIAENAERDIWGIGLADAIIGRLASLRNLAVRPTSSVMKYAKAAADPEEVARDLDVESVLDGTFYRVGDVVRVSVQLISRQRTTQWASRYDLRANDVLRFQDEVSQRVVDGLRVRVSPTERALLAAPITTSADAYDLYVQASFHWTEYSVRSTRSSMQESQRLLEQAIALDPTFAHAHALLGRLLAYSVANFPDDTAADLARAEASAHAALHINPQLSDAWTALGAAYTQGGRNEDAIGALRRALGIAPNSELALDTLGYACHYAGLLEKAEDATRRTRELNPTSRRLRWMHARFLLYLDRIPEAIALMEFARGTENSKALAHLGKLLYYDGRLDAAEDVFERALTPEKLSEDPAVFVLSAYLQAARGQRNRIHPSVLSREPSATMDGDLVYWTGGVHALLNDRQRALAWLRRAVELGNHNYPWFCRDKNYDSLRGDPEYEGILADVRRRWERYRSLFDDLRI
jgi:TolB-like protein/tetratricopeptide (TPR) repeat protein